MRRRFATLDVFTGRRFAGNPLAVVLDVEGLDGTAMQTIAREFNLSETVFVLPPQSRAHEAELRIFTPGAELPFAGHPTVGTAVLLGRTGAGSREMILEEGVGNIHCKVELFEAAHGRAEFDLPRLPRETRPAAEFAGLLARCETLADGEHAFQIEQGYEMGRPSLIELSISIRQGELVSAAIAGDAVLVTEGMIEA